MKKYILLLFILSSTEFDVQAQSGQLQLITPCGNSISNSSYTLDYSIGEVATTTLIGGGNANTQGFNQPNYNTTTSLNESDVKSFIIYPNPSTQLINIQGANNLEDFNWKIVNVLGKIIDYGSLSSIDISHLSSGIYSIDLMRKNVIIQTEQFVKQ